MTDIERKALALLNKVNTERNKKGATFVYVDRSSCVLTEALCRAIEHHEQFKRDVSDKVEAVLNCKSRHDELICIRELASLIPPKPVDPLVEALNAVRDNPCIRDTAEIANDLRAALAKLGHEVREIEG